MAAWDSISTGVRVFVVQDGRFLLVLNQDKERSWWSLPGGGAEAGEALGQAAVREVWEETGLDVRLTDLILLRELVGRYHVMGATFRAEVIGGSVTTENDPVEAVREVRWVTVDEATQLMGDDFGPLAERALSDAHAYPTYYMERQGETEE